MVLRKQPFKKTLAQIKIMKSHPLHVPVQLRVLVMEPLQACLWHTLLLCCLLWVPRPHMPVMAHQSPAAEGPRAPARVCPHTCLRVYLCVCAWFVQPACSLLSAGQKLQSTAPGLRACYSTELHKALQKFGAWRLHCFLVPASDHPRREA